LQRLSDSITGLEKLTWIMIIDLPQKWQLNKNSLYVICWQIEFLNYP
jgi:hypothetical protein